MSYETAFDDLMTETVTIETVASTDEYGARSYNAASSHAARIVHRFSQVTDFEGRLVASAGWAWISGTSLPAALGPLDRMTLPDSTAPPIVAVEKYFDEDEAHHFKVFFGTSGMLR